MAGRLMKKEHSPQPFNSSEIYCNVLATVVTGTGPSLAGVHSLLFLFFPFSTTFPFSSPGLYAILLCVAACLSDDV